MMGLNGKDVWVVVADSTQCKIYEYLQHPEDIKLLKQIDHPENHLKDVDIVTDRQGHVQQGNYVNSDPKKIAVDKFSREIAQQLDTYRKRNAYKHLIMISSPHMQGLINLHMNKHVQHMVDLEFDKDIVHYNQKQLLNFLHKQTRII